MDVSQSSNQKSNAKSNSFENLSREELVKKCKGLLLIAQKAKQIKDDIHEENKALKEQLQNYEIQKQADKKCLAAMQEMVSSSTQNNQIQPADSNKNEPNHFVNQEKYEEILIENNSLKLQIKMLIAENEEYLKSIETFGPKIASPQDDKQKYEQEIAALQNEIKLLQSKNLKNEENLKQFKSKLLEFSAKLKHFKSNHKILLEIINDYRKTVPKWQTEISKVSSNICEKVLFYEKRNKELLNRIKSLESSTGGDSRHITNELKFKAKTLENMKELFSDRLNNISNVLSKIELLHEEERAHSNANEIATIKLKDNSLENFADKLNNISDVLTKIETLNDEERVRSNDNSTIELERCRAILKCVFGQFRELFDQDLEGIHYDKDDCEIPEDIAEVMLNHLAEFSSISSSRRVTEALFKSQIEDYKCQVEINEMELNKLNNLVESYESKFKEFAVEFNTVKLENDDYKTKMAELKGEQSKPCDQCNQVSVKLGEIITLQSEETAPHTSILDNINEIKNQAVEKIRRIKDLNDRIQELQKTINTINSNIDLSKSENQDLLQEMKEINQILKERGGVISKQQSKILEMENRIQILEDELNMKTDNLVVKQKDLETVENLIKEKDNEIQKYKVMCESTQFLKEKTMSVSDKFEVLSTSTISKTEGQHRLREVDDSFEEKYNKLRVLAVKLKHKITEQNGVLATLESDNKSLTEKLSSLNSIATKDSNRLVEVEENWRKTILELENKEKQVKNSQEVEKSLRAELEKSKITAKKSNVLSLEIEAYEKSLTDINQKLELNKIQIADLEETNRNLNLTINSLNEQIKLVEENLESEKKFSIELKHKNDMQQTRIREIDSQKLETIQKYENLQMEHEHLKLELDQVSVKLSDSTIEKDKEYSVLLIEKENLLKQIASLKNEYDTLHANYNLKENEIENLKAEFANYKVRAQSVLRQNHSKEGSREKELEDDMMSMQTTIEAMTVKLKDTTNENLNLMKTISDLKVDTEMFQNRCNELLALLDTTRLEYETNLDDIRKQNCKQQEIIKTQRNQIDSIHHCYKIQMSEKDEKYAVEIKTLREKQSVTMPASQNSMHGSMVDNNNESFTDILKLPGYNSITTDEQKIQMILQEKEMAEISNSDVGATQSKTFARQKYETIPLDQLLNNPIEDSTIEKIRPISPTQELNTTKETVVAQSSQIKHLSTLLAEAEQDLLRLTQLNEVLKQEVRKQQLNLEREQHIQNSEYMKNVILKFVTLNSGDEKLHLVPVLNTILKLSPEETHKLQNVAKGEGSKWLERFPLWSNNS